MGNLRKLEMVGALAALFAVGTEVPAGSAGGCVAMGANGPSGDVTCEYEAVGRGGAVAATLNPWKVAIWRNGGWVVVAKSKSGTTPFDGSVPSNAGETVRVTLEASSGRTDGFVWAGI